MEPPVEQLTAQGFDLTFGVNAIGLLSQSYSICLTSNWFAAGHWYFTELLLPALLAVAKEDPTQKARVITTSSYAAYMETIHWDAIEDTPQRRKLAPNVLYWISKTVGIILCF